DWEIQPNLKAEHIYDGFKALALLEYHLRKNSQLVVPHDGNQRLRFHSAMEDFNKEIKIIGQPEADHRCDGCVRIIKGQDGEPDKEVFLVGRFCEKHIHLEKVCSIRGCEEQVEPGFKTCSNHSHRDAEEQYFRPAGKSTMQLKARFEQQMQEQLSDQEMSLPAGEQLDTASAAVNDMVNSGVKPAIKSSACHGDFDRNHTHNQQYIVTPCGII
ncbi:hypothetical protein MPER_04903, partial [Moniliophthora perniciosa FA553]